ncbi:T9SS type A sorting domain-containing protein [Hymenobacter sp. 15J16-1T3B]|uniref:endo-beta-N-acetylglucosaminidase n=1 Tax=Hymenobacter sp. 15J16-1T3B TaxID=2886941 RepID=UPI001D11DA89|nr:LamG-like jellyroll fold domain-containing protein [Hymenobacter sp. 15J16-1T3B]MCC3159610.1 T9SS type A sorting domain-containing protein [Hymenobacter sp. 15J16-1T3B]
MKQLYPFTRLVAPTTGRAWRRRAAALLTGCLLLGAPRAEAQIEPAAQYTKLTMAQFMAWTPTGPTAVPANVSQVPLVPRQNSLPAQLNPAQSFSQKVNYIPDGMANFAGYLNEQNHFNLYNFTHWQYIDVLTWFDGTVGIPTRPWVETAHRNGVKVIGTVFTNAADVAALIQKDASGNYLGAQKLVAMANYYGFDGWFFNQENTVPAATALELRALLQQLQAIKPAGMEIHWYDAMRPNGVLSYQNALNANNAAMLQDGTARVSDAMFTNYFWSGATNINTSVTTANALGRSPFDVYMGADIWPGRNPQGLFARTTWLDNYFTNGDLTQPKVSLGLFATNLTYNGGFNNFNNTPSDYANFYRTEQRIFAGDDYDVTTADASGWKGLGYYLPVRSVINTLPFETNFSVGQGKIFANNGAVVQREWTDMGKQSLLPSWQWAKTGAAPVTVGFDFDDAYYGGNSLKLAGSLSGSDEATVKLYQTKLPITATTSFELTYKAGAAGATNTNLLLYFSDNLAAPVALSLGTASTAQWTTRTFPLAAYAGRELAIIGVQATATAAVPAYRLNLGKFSLYNGTLVTRPVAGFAASATRVVTGEPVTFANSSTNATAYRWTLPGATPASSTAIHPVVSYAAPGTYSVKLRAESGATRDSLTRTDYVTVVPAATPGGNTALLYDGVGKFVDAGTINLSGSALSLECWVKVNAFKTGAPYISSLMGTEDGGSAAMLRLGDAGLAANRVQFVLNGTNLASATALAANTWYHIAGVYDGATMKIYLNGVLDASGAAPASITSNAAFVLGRNYANSRCLDGSLDELRVWKRALSAAEVAANACQVSSSAPGLEAYWPCNEATGAVANDVSGHGHTGTLTGMVLSDWTNTVPTQCAGVTATASPRNASGLQVQVLGNPASGNQAELEIRGAQGQAAVVELVNSLGAVVRTFRVSPAAGATQRVALTVPEAAGVYVVRVRTAGATAATKLLKQ